MKWVFFVIAAMTLWAFTACAQPEFHSYSKRVSGRAINCAMCHTHPDGPAGVKPGQIGRLNEEELNTLGLARQAFKPGANVLNPILNQFGNALLNDLGKDQLTEMRQHPELLAEAISKTRDLDGDGISDAQEFLDGTHPLNSLDGHPWKLFQHNFLKNRFHILLMVLATVGGLYSLKNLLLWLSSKVEGGQ